MKKFLWGHTAKELAEEFSVPLSTVYVWCGNWKKELAVKALADIPLEDMGKLLLHIWGLYVRYRKGRTLTQLCDETGIADKPLREWFRNFNQLYEQSCSAVLEDIRRWNSQINFEIQKKYNERDVLQQIFETIPEILRIACAHPLLERYGPNQVCRVLKIRKSNLYYQIFHKPTVTVYEKHNQELRPVIQAICAAAPKRIGAEAIRQQLMGRGYTTSKGKVLELLHEIQPWQFVQTKKEVSCDD